MQLSIRARLTLLYSGVLALVLIFVALVTYSAVAQLSQQSADNTLDDAVSTFVMSTRGAARRAQAPEDALALAADRLRFRDSRVFVYDASGALVGASRVPPGAIM